MRATLLSIQPKWLAKILNGEKTIEVRKHPLQGWVYLYCTKGKPYLTKIYGEYYISKYTCDESPSGNVIMGNGKVVARFYVDKVDTIVRGGMGFVVKNESRPYTNELARNSCLDYQDLNEYLKDKDGYANHITKLEIFDKPKELGEFHKTGYEEAMKEIDHIELTGACLNQHEFKPANSALRQVTEDMYRVIKAPQSRMYIDVKE